MKFKSLSSLPLSFSLPAQDGCSVRWRPWVRYGTERHRREDSSMPCKGKQTSSDHLYIRPTKLLTLPVNRSVKPTNIIHNMTIHLII